MRDRRPSYQSFSGFVDSSSCPEASLFIVVIAAVSLINALLAGIWDLEVDDVWGSRDSLVEFVVFFLKLLLDDSVLLSLSMLRDDWVDLFVRGGRCLGWDRFLPGNDSSNLLNPLIHCRRRWSDQVERRLFSVPRRWVRFSKGTSASTASSQHLFSRSARPLAFLMGVMWPQLVTCVGKRISLGIFAGFPVSSLEIPHFLCLWMFLVELAQ